jgi:hypothetical protein
LIALITIAKYITSKYIFRYFQCSL